MLHSLNLVDLIFQNLKHKYSEIIYQIVKRWFEKMEQSGQILYIVAFQ